MICGLYCVKDVKLERFQPPFICRDDNEARIVIARAGFNPLVYADLDLFKVASFDDSTGIIELCQPMVRLGLPDVQKSEV